MAFQALEISLEMVRSLRGPLEAIRGRDPQLFRQMRAAASSVPMNLAEGRRRSGGDRLHSWRIAAGSADEVRTALRVAMAWGDLDPSQAAVSLGLIDRVLAMLWKLTR